MAQYGFVVAGNPHDELQLSAPRGRQAGPPLVAFPGAGRRRRAWAARCHVCDCARAREEGLSTQRTRAAAAASAAPGAWGSFFACVVHESGCLRVTVALASCRGALAARQDRFRPGRGAGGTRRRGRIAAGGPGRGGTRSALAVGGRGARAAAAAGRGCAMRRVRVQVRQRAAPSLVLWRWGWLWREGVCASRARPQVAGGLQAPHARRRARGGGRGLLLRAGARAGCASWSRQRRKLRRCAF